jgi:diketogulonate reductase-like aldo/keto reductase
MHRYISPPAVAATTKYQEIADSFDLPLAGIALSYVTSRPFTTSTIFGATNNQQLEDNVLSLNIPISDEIHGEIDKIHKEHLDPTKGSFEIYDLSQEYIDPSKLPWGAKDQDVDPELDILINERLSKF